MAKHLQHSFVYDGGGLMSRVLLHLDHKENSNLLAEWLGKRYEVILPDGHLPLDAHFDLCVLDTAALDRLGNQLRARKDAEKSVFLPFLLITSRQNVDSVAQQLWYGLDDVLLAPVEKVELQARVESLLSARRLSLELKLRNEDLESFVDAMTHELRAPLRSITGFADALIEDHVERLDPKGREFVERIRGATGQMWNLIDSLLAFSRVGRREAILQDIGLERAIEESLERIHDHVQSAHARVVMRRPLPVVKADSTLLQIALDNILSNAIKFVAPGVEPSIEISCVKAGGVCRLRIQDNGIGIDPDNQRRIFTPFVRLHGVESYPGLGLGLSAARKVVEMMGGRLELQSAPEKGSSFYIELAVSDAEPHSVKPGEIEDAGR